MKRIYKRQFVRKKSVAITYDAAKCFFITFVNRNLLIIFSDLKNKIAAYHKRNNGIYEMKVQ
jgi:hypothetical protein